MRLAECSSAPSVPQAAPCSAAAQCIETDRTYFELGARIRQLPGACLAWMPQLAQNPAAAVIHRVRPNSVAALGKDWIARAEVAFAATGAQLARIYCDKPGTRADDLMRCTGYVDRRETLVRGFP